MTTRKYGECSFIRLVADAPKQALADQWSKTPPTMRHASRVLQKAAAESDHIAWAAGMVCVKNIKLFGAAK